jgi:RNA polymerase sigma-70 factor (ECF subfamily)
MQHGAGDAGRPVVLVRTAPIDDVVTVPLPLPLPRVRLPAPAVRQGSSVGRLQTVDREAAEALFNACYPRLAGWVRRLVDDDDTAHEIASEAFTRLLARWSGLDSPQSYLYMIATNLVRDHWRKSGRERRAIRSLTAAVPADPAYHPAQDVDVRALIEGLPARLRSVFLLHYYAGFPVREVASMLGRPEGTIKADLHHARARLKAALGDTDG